MLPILHSTNPPNTFVSLLTKPHRHILTTPHRMKNKNNTFDRKAQGDIVIEYLEQYGNVMMKQTLARLIYDKHPEAFSDMQRVRGLIRYYTGTSGAKHLSDLGDRRFIGLCQPPQSEAEERQDFTLPVTANNCLLMSDIHVPYHDNKAVTAALEWGKSKQVNTIILNGDFMDFYNLSKFLSDPRKRNLRAELDAGYEMMYYIANKLPKAKIYFLPGNHEQRLEKYLQMKAPELLGAEPWISDLDFFLRFSEFGVSYLRSAQIIRAGELFICHGHEFRGGSGGINPARTFFLKTYANVIAGHFHKISEDSTRGLDGLVKTCWSMGCLCGLTPDYMPYNRWGHGFANVRINDDKTFRVFNAQIFNGKVL